MQAKTTLIRQLYTVLFGLALPIVLLRLLIRSQKIPAYRQRWKERFGIISAQAKPTLWIHTVSVGETIAAIPLIEKMIKRFPDKRIFVTTTTPTGSEQVKQRLGNRVIHSYIPYDIPFFIRRFIKQSKAKICIILETEIWPNILYVCQQQGIPTILANARLSEKSMQGYQRLGTIGKDMINLFTHITAQSQLDADHYQQLGVDGTKITVTGSIKFDHQPPADINTRSLALRREWHALERPIWIAASTRDKEEPLILEAFKKLLQQHPILLLIIAPRHPQRFKTVQQLCLQAGFNVGQKSQPSSINENTQIIIGDTLGELVLLYDVADICYVGGSLVPVGGHNILEPAMLGKPIITGPALRNFKVISKLLTNNGALNIVHTPTELASKVKELLENPKQQQYMGEQAKKTIAENVGAVDKQLGIIASVIPQN